MDESSKRKQSSGGGGIFKFGPIYFIYTNETKDTDISKSTLTHLRIDSSVTEIALKAFQNCNRLVQVQIPVDTTSLTRIGESAFQSCPNLKYVQFVSSSSSHENETSKNVNPFASLKKDWDASIVFPKSATTNNVLQVDDYAFSDCTSLQKIIVRCSISTRLTGKGIFSGCMGLISVQLPQQGLTVIEDLTFCRCYALTNVTIPSSVIKIGRQAFEGCQKVTAFHLPHGLVEIGEAAFGICHSIETLDIPPTVSKIGKTAFHNCSQLRQIKLPPSTMERIESHLFLGCTGLESIEIPSTISFIEESAFRNCSSLSHVRIPPSVDRMVDWPFARCDSLISIELSEEIVIAIDERIASFSFPCPLLVNLAIPTLPEDHSEEFTSNVLYKNSKLGTISDGSDDLARRLKHRFDACPLNKLCYYQSYHSEDSMMMQLRRLMMEDGDPLAATTQLDEFGMTPLHILSLSQTPNMDMLLAVMKGGHANHIIHCRDSFGSTPMDYLCWNRMPNSNQVIRRILQTRFIDYHSWPMMDDSGESSTSTMWDEAIEEALEADWSSRRREIVSVYFKLANYERNKIILSLVEMCLWKIQIDNDDDDISSSENTLHPETAADRRQSCRIKSGASIVIPHLLPFLDKLLDVEDYFAAHNNTQQHSVHNLTQEF